MFDAVLLPQHFIDASAYVHVSAHCHDYEQVRLPVHLHDYAQDRVHAHLHVRDHDLLQGLNRLNGDAIVINH